MRSTYFQCSALLRIILIYLIGFACCVVRSESADITVLIANLANNDPVINQEAASQLVILGDNATTSLGGLLINQTPEEVKLRAISTLAKIGSPSAASSLVLALRRQHKSLPSETICTAVTKAIGDIGTPALPVLFKEIQNPDEASAATAVRICGIIGGETVIQPLIGVLKSKQSLVRQEAISSLGKLKANAAVQALLPLLKDSDLAVRYKAIYALSLIGDPQAIAPIAKLLKDKNYYLGIFAGEALTNFNNPLLISHFVDLIANRPNVEKAMEKAVGNRADSLADQKANMNSVNISDTAEYIRRSLLSSQYFKELYPQIYTQEYRRVDILYMLIAFNLSKYGDPAKEQLIALRNSTKNDIVRKTTEMALLKFEKNTVKSLGE